jgi:hypothetical protein
MHEHAKMSTKIKKAKKENKYAFAGLSPRKGLCSLCSLIYIVRGS